MHIIVDEVHLEMDLVFYLVNQYYDYIYVETFINGLFHGVFERARLRALPPSVSYFFRELRVAHF